MVKNFKLGKISKKLFFSPPLGQNQYLQKFLFLQYQCGQAQKQILFFNSTFGIEDSIEISVMTD